MNLERMNLESNHQVKKSPWPFWATVGLGFLVGIVLVTVQIIVAVGFVVIEQARNPQLDDEAISAFAENIATNGFFLAVVACVSAVLCIALIVLLIRLRQDGLSVKHYLDIQPVAAKRLLGWLGVLLVFVIIQDSMTHLLGRPLVPEFMVTVYKTAYFTPLLWLALIVAAPLFEEIFFRGFLFKGFQHSKIGTMGAIVITSFLWAMIHLQYDGYEKNVIFIMGILLGIARATTQSIYVPIAMHAGANLIATIEVIIYIGMS